MSHGRCLSPRLASRSPDPVFVASCGAALDCSDPSAWPSDRQPARPSGRTAVRVVAVRVRVRVRVAVRVPCRAVPCAVPHRRAHRTHGVHTRASHTLTYARTQRLEYEAVQLRLHNVHAKLEWSDDPRLRNQVRIHACARAHTRGRARARSCRARALVRTHEVRAQVEQWRANARKMAQLHAAQRRLSSTPCRHPHAQ